MFKSIPVTPSIPVGVPGGGGTPGAVPIGSTLKDLGIIGILSAGLSVGLTEIVPRLTKGVMEALGMNTKPSANPADRGGGMFGAPQGVGTADYFIDKIFGGGKLYGSMKDGITEGIAPVAAYLGRDITWESSTTIKVDGQVLADVVDRRLGIRALTSGVTRTGGR
jgi:hypothetical protein